jgi:DNA invertase Pin-like site-specific DNA recombinase
MEIPNGHTPKTMAGEAKRAVLFIRVNRRAAGNDAAEAQVERQRQRGQDVARQLGAFVVREYVDYGGGVGIEQRPVIEAMLDDLTAQRDADYVIADDWARLTRRADDMVVIHRVAEEVGARLIVGGSEVQAEILELFGFGEVPIRRLGRAET